MNKEINNHVVKETNDIRINESDVLRIQSINEGIDSYSWNLETNHKEYLKNTADGYIQDNFDMTLEELKEFIGKYEPERLL